VQTTLVAIWKVALEYSDVIEKGFKTGHS